MSKRQKSTIETTMDSVNIQVIKFWVSGTAGANPQDSGGPSNMTASFIDGTDQKMVVTAFSGALGAYGYGSQVFPTGSVHVLFPSNNIYNKTLHWEVGMEASGTDHKANSLSSIWQYSVCKYGHNTPSGSFVLGFQRLSGSAVQDVDAMGSSGSYVGAIPEDRINPSSPACEVSVEFFLRDTKRTN